MGDRSGGVEDDEGGEEGGDGGGGRVSRTFKVVDLRASAAAGEATTRFLSHDDATSLKEAILKVKERGAKKKILPGFKAALSVGCLKCHTKLTEKGVENPKDPTKGDDGKVGGSGQGTAVGLTLLCGDAVCRAGWGKVLPKLRWRFIVSEKSWIRETNLDATTGTVMGRAKYRPDEEGGSGGGGSGSGGFRV